MKKIGILCAGDTELAPFLEHMKGQQITEKAMLKFHTGTINPCECVRRIQRRLQSKRRHCGPAFDRYVPCGLNHQPVSYTHLTLPTKLEV